MKKQLVNAVTITLLAGSLITPVWAAGRRVKEVNQRERNQQKRIVNGIKSGELTPAETARIERREAQIRREERAYRADSNGRLTKAEQRDLNRDLNRTSRMIQHEKHD